MHDKNGKLIEIEYGFDGKYFVTTLKGKIKKFVSDYPNDLNEAARNIRNSFQEAQQHAKNIELFKDLDPNVYYAGWWAPQFR